MRRLILCVLVVAACSKPGPPPPDTYEYSLSAGGNFNENPMIPIRINGKDAGTNSRLVVPRDVLLGDPKTKLEAVLDTTCGEEAFVLEPGPRSPDEAAARAKDPAARIDWTVRPVTLPTPTWVYIDNAWGNDTKVQLGTKSFSLRGGKSMNVQVLPGSCATGRTVTMDGTVVGEVPELGPGWAILVSTTKDMCFVAMELVYAGAWGAGARETAAPEVWKLAGHVGKVGEMDYPLVEPPSEIPDEDRGAIVKRRLMSMPCEMWAKAGKSRRKARKPG